MTHARGLRLQLMGAAWIVIAGCAPLPAPAGGTNVPPASAIPVSASTPPRSELRFEPARPGVVRDSTPSAAAERVLATLPEPLAPWQQVPPPRGTGTVTMSAPPAAYDTLRVNRTETVRAPESAYDTLRVERAPENDASAVPVPSPTQPLGNNPGGTLTMPDTLTAPPTAAPTAAPSATTTPPSTAGPSTSEPAKSGEVPAASPAAGECWRLQVAAPVEKAKAESRRAAAQSLLMAPMVIKLEQGLYKVRTSDCMTRAAAEALKSRAIDSGFAGAFVLNSVATPAPVTLKPKPRVTHARHPARKRSATKPRR